MATSAVELSDIQALLRFGHGRLKGATFFLLQIADRAAARAWLEAAKVTSAADPPAPTALQIALTCDGLQALGIPDSVIAGFSPEFIAGMTGEESRARRLGDLGASDPSRWDWGRQGRAPHLAVLLYATTPDDVAAAGRALQDTSWSSAFRVLAALETSDMDGIEPFGFADGISQPVIDWERRMPVATGDRIAYGNLSALGEFVLGYPNEYGKYTERPLLEAAQGAELPAAEDQPDKRDIGRNGTYLVLRQLSQDVRGFWQFLDREAKSDEAARRQLAEVMVGRTMSGWPLVPIGDRPLAGVGPKADDIRLNRFTYDGDPAGRRCPLGAHVRRANPRNADLPGHPGSLIARLIRILGFSRGAPQDDLMASVRFHRILRRGREYGEALPPAAALDAGSPQEDRGLYFICLNANIARQFEFVQNAWIVGTKFNGLTGESDPLLGNRQPIAGCPATDTFSIPQENGVPRRVTGLPQFVTVRGGAYFFLPGIRALRYLARAGA